MHSALYMPISAPSCPAPLYDREECTPIRLANGRNNPSGKDRSLSKIRNASSFSLRFLDGFPRGVQIARIYHMPSLQKRRNQVHLFISSDKRLQGMEQYFAHSELS